VSLGEGEAASVEAVGALDVLDEVAELGGEGEDACDLIVGHGHSLWGADLQLADLHPLEGKTGANCKSASWTLC